MFTAELALELKMPISELGQRMSNYELNVIWPAFYRAKAKERRLAEEARKKKK